MIRILFVCHGNICRSPMAEYVMKDMVKKAGFEDKIVVASAAAHTDEIGSPVYPPVRKLTRASTAAHMPQGFCAHPIIGNLIY